MFNYYLLLRNWISVLLIAGFMDICASSTLTRSALWIAVFLPTDIVITWIFAFGIAVRILKKYPLDKKFLAFWNKLDQVVLFHIPVRIVFFLAGTYQFTIRYFCIASLFVAKFIFIWIDAYDIFLTEIVRIICWGVLISFPSKPRLSAFFITFRLFLAFKIFMQAGILLFRTGRFIYAILFIFGFFEFLVSICIEKAIDYILTVVLNNKKINDYFGKD